MVYLFDFCTECSPRADLSCGIVAALKDDQLKTFARYLGFAPEEGKDDVYRKSYSNHDTYTLRLDFNKQVIDYGSEITRGDLTTSNFSSSENFVVLECINRLLEKGYKPRDLTLEQKWPMGRKEKGKLDILVRKDAHAYLMIECKTWGAEYDKEKNKMFRDGGQLFSYFQQDKAAHYLCLYASRFEHGTVESVNDIVQVDDEWRELNNQKEVHDHWNKNFKDNGIFEAWASAYDVEVRALTRGRLRELNAEDGGRIFNQFAEILRHNVVSDKPNAFNKIFNLFLCKIVDENRKATDELQFQWLENDTDIELQKRLSDLYKRGMKDYLMKNVTDYSDAQINEQLYALDESARKQIQEMFTRVRLYKNNEFAFKEVFDDKSFKENADVVREVVELLQPYQIRYGHKQQFLGDFFELLLSTGIKQEAGQFFTPVPIARFIISSLPLRELVNKKIANDEIAFLPYIIDYAAGSGHFLTEAMDEVQTIVDNMKPDEQVPLVGDTLNSWHASKYAWADEYIYGIEADYRLVKTAKVSCFLNGDGKAKVIHADGLGSFRESKEYIGKLKELSPANPQDNAQFDVLVANPPYSVSAFKNTLKHGDESFELYDRLTDDSSEIECLFIERAKQLVKPGGWAAIILPSSILSNSGIYTGAREIILKYFEVKAITEFGSNTFMATGTNTVTLFLERRPNNKWKEIEQTVKRFFENPKEATVNGVEKAFSKYVAEVFTGLELADYVSFVKGAPNEVISQHELFTDYAKWFDGLNEVRVKKSSKAFKEMSEAAQETELDKLFYDKVCAREQDKMLYYFLALPQKTVVIKTGDKQAEKDFIGYEFSSRRGHEGIRMFRDAEGKPTTKLYDNDNPLNPEKASSYVYKALLGEVPDVDATLTDNIRVVDTVELMNFKPLSFEKSLSLNTKKKVLISSKWDLVRLGDVCSFDYGKSLPENNRVEGEYPVMGSNGRVGFHNKYIVEGPTIVIGRKGSAGAVTWENKNCFPIDTTFFVGWHDARVAYKYLFLILKQLRLGDIQGGLGVPGLNRNDAYAMSVPLPPIEIQEKIIAEIKIIEGKQEDARKRLSELWSKSNEGTFSGFPEVKLKNLCSMIRRGKSTKYGASNIQIIKSGQARGYTNFDFSKKHFVAEGFVSDERNLQKGDVLLNSTGVGTAGRVTLFELAGDFVADSHITILRLDSSKALPRFVLYTLARIGFKNIEKMATGQSGQIELSLSIIENIKVSLPPLTEQVKLVSEFEALETEIATIEASLTDLEAEKDQILKKYLE